MNGIKHLVCAFIVICAMRSFATEIGENILKNGSFEEGTVIPSGKNFNVIGEECYTDFWTGNAKLEKVGSALQGNANLYDGTYAVAFQGDCYIQQELEVETEGYYQLSFQYTRRTSGSHYYVLITVDDDDTGIRFLANNSTSVQQARLPPFKLTRGQHTLRIDAVRHYSTADLTLNLDNLALRLFGTGDVGAEALVNGGFEEETANVGTKQTAFTDGATSRGWTGTGGAKLAVSGTAFGGFYDSSIVNGVLNWDYGAILQTDSSITGTVMAPTHGKYRLTYYWKNRAASSTQTLEVKIGDIVVRANATLENFTSRQFASYEDIELEAGEYPITFTTACAKDHSFFLDEVSLMCTEELVDADKIIERPEVATADVVYDGLDHKPEIAESEHYTIEYDPAGAWTAVGDYAVTITLDDGYVWDDYSTKAIVSNLTIRPRAVERPAIATDWLVYTGEDLRPVFADTDDYTVTYSPDAAWVNEGTDYHLVFQLKDQVNTRWANGDANDLDIQFAISQSERLEVDKPVQAWLRRVATGTDLKPSFPIDAGYTVSYSAPEWIAVGTYTVTLTPKLGYRWSDQTGESVVFTYHLVDRGEMEVEAVGIITDEARLSPGTDIIVNGGFELGSQLSSTYAILDGTSVKTDAWYVEGDSANSGIYLEKAGSSILSDNTLIIGTYALALHGGGVVSVHQQIKVPIDGYYQLSFRGSRRSGYGGWNGLSAHVDGMPLEFCCESQNTDTAPRTFESPLMFLASGEHVFSFARDSQNRDSTYNIDDVSLKLVSAGKMMLAGVGPSANYVVNGSFEAYGGADGQGAASWKFSTIECLGWGSATDDNGGDKLLRLGALSAPAGYTRYLGAVQGWGTFFGSIKAPVKGKYTLSYRTAKRDQQNGAHLVTVKIDDQVLKENESVTDTNWQTVEISDIELDAGEHTLSVYAVQEIAGKDVTTFYDDFSLVLNEITAEGPVGELLGVEYVAEKVEGDATNLLVKVGYSLVSLGAEASEANVELLYGYVPEELTFSVPLTTATVTGVDFKPAHMKQSPKTESVYFMALKFTANSGKTFTTPVKMVSLPKRVIRKSTLLYLR